MSPLTIPGLLGAVAGYSAWHWCTYPIFVDPDAASAFGGTVASISTTMLGFLLAALAVLASISHTHLLGVMREQGHYRDLLNTMLIGFLFFLLCAIEGFSVLFGVSLTPLLGSVLVGTHVAAFVSLLDIGRKLWLVLRNLR
jgi:hypothetical protein